MTQTDVCIIGAGPGGAATALKLSYLGIPCILIDKASFPRDKICGDAISGKVTTLLNRLDPEIMKRFTGQPIQKDVWGIKFVAANGKEVRIPFKPNYIKNAVEAPGYVSKRIDFDNFLIEEVKRRKNINFFDQTLVDHFERSDRGFIVVSQDQKLAIDTKLLIVANGAYSNFSRKFAGLEKDIHHYASAIRMYYKNVKGMDKDGFIELHFIKSLTPGYFWVFPLPNGEANIGLGMRSDYLKNRKVNLRKTLEELIQSHPVLKERFKEAEPIGPTKGYGLPLGSKTRILSGDHYMLVGDAGHLIDPLTGEGIGNAVYSGFIAAEQAQKCLAVQDFSKTFLRDYDTRVQRVLGSEMKLSYRLQYFLGYPFIVNILASIISGNQKIVDVLSRMYTDFDVRKRLVKPFFWVKLFIKGKKQMLSSTSTQSSHHKPGS